MGVVRMRQQWCPGRFFSTRSGLGTRLLYTIHIFTTPPFLVRAPNVRMQIHMARETMTRQPISEIGVRQIKLLPQASEVKSSSI